MWDDLAMPREFSWSQSDRLRDRLCAWRRTTISRWKAIGEYGVDIGYFFDEHSSIGATAKPTWLKNIWQNDLAELPVSDDVKRDLIKWRTTNPDTEGHVRRRSSRATSTRCRTATTSRKSLGYRPEVTKMIEPVIGLISGASPDAVSAHAAQQIGMPGVSRARGREQRTRALVSGRKRHLRPSSREEADSRIRSAATRSFEGVLNGKVNWAALDRANQPTRIRVGATVVRVEHAGSPDGPVCRRHVREGRTGCIAFARVASRWRAAGG